jgi:hypothetical protein
MMVKVNEVAVEKEFEVFVDLKTTLSLKVSSENEKIAIEKALTLIDENAIQQLLLTLVLHNGKVVMPKIHDFTTENINVFGEDE